MSDEPSTDTEGRAATDMRLARDGSSLQDPAKETL